MARRRGVLGLGECMTSAYIVPTAGLRGHHMLGAEFLVLSDSVLACSREGFCGSFAVFVFCV